MNLMLKKIRPPSPGIVLGVIAIVVALTGTAIAASTLKLGQFDKSSRDRLAGTGVVQYASQTHTVIADGYATLQTFRVDCELAKKASAGGYKFEGTPPTTFLWDVLDAYPTGGGFVVRGYFGGAANAQLTVYANCVKSRKQTGTPPS